MTAIARTAHGADADLGRTILGTLDIAERACEDGSAFASELLMGKPSVSMSPRAVDRTDLCHLQTVKHAPRLSIIGPARRIVVIEIMLHAEDAHLGLLPVMDEDQERRNARACIALVRREIEGWLTDGDDHDAFTIACSALKGAAHAVLEAMQRNGDPTGPIPTTVWLRHATSWSPLRIGKAESSQHLPWADRIAVEAIGDAMAPPVVSLDLQPGGDELRLIVGPAILRRSRDGMDVLSAMRDLAHAQERMKERRP